MSSDQILFQMNSNNSWNAEPFWQIQLQNIIIVVSLPGQAHPGKVGLCPGKEKTFQSVAHERADTL